MQILCTDISQEVQNSVFIYRILSSQLLYGDEVSSTNQG